MDEGNPDGCGEGKADGLDEVEGLELGVEVEKLLSSRVRNKNNPFLLSVTTITPDSKKG